MKPIFKTKTIITMADDQVVDAEIVLDLTWQIQSEHLGQCGPETTPQTLNTQITLTPESARSLRATLDAAISGYEDRIES